MTHIPYSFEQVEPTRYKFLSQGKRKIEKVVEFVPLKAKNVMNLGFGDLLPDGSIDDRVVSNNGDIRKVLATVVMILKDFTARHPQTIIFFTGSNNERTRMYSRILKLYHTTFKKEFLIYVVVGNENNSKTLLFDPNEEIEYLAFLIKRIN